MQASKPLPNSVLLPVAFNSSKWLFSKVRGVFVALVSPSQSILDTTNHLRVDIRIGWWWRAMTCRKHLVALMLHSGLSKQRMRWSRWNSKIHGWGSLWNTSLSLISLFQKWHMWGTCGWGSCHQWHGGGPVYDRTIREFNDVRTASSLPDRPLPPPHASAITGISARTGKHPQNSQPHQYTSQSTMIRPLLTLAVLATLAISTQVS